jgi:hypothetical protein
VDNIKIDFRKKIGCVSSHGRSGEGFVKNGNELSVFIKFAQLLDCLRTFSFPRGNMPLGLVILVVLRLLMQHFLPPAVHGPVAPQTVKDPARSASEGMSHQPA